MDYCSHCGAKSSPSWVFCRDCGAGLDVAGAAVRPAFCTSCAYGLALSWRYCPRCGVETPVADRERSTRLTVENAGALEATAHLKRQAPLVPEVVETPEVELISRGWDPAETEWVDVSEPDMVVTLPEDDEVDVDAPEARSLPDPVPASANRPGAATATPPLPGRTATELTLLGAGLAALGAVMGLIVLNRLLVSFAAGSAAADDIARLERFVTTWLEVAVVPLLAAGVALLVRWRRHHARPRVVGGPPVVPIAAGARWAAPAGLGGGSAVVLLGRLLPRTTVGQAVDANTWVVIGLGLLILGCLAGVRLVAALSPLPRPDEPTR